VSRTRLRRLPEHGVADPEVRDAILDAGRVAHVGIAGPFVIPIGYARDGDRLLIHGSTGSRLMRELAAGAGACVTVTLLDGLILARSAFESSMRYRSVMVFGSFSTVDGPEKLVALRRISDHLLPDRWPLLRPMMPKELAATLVLALPLTEWSAKANDGMPADPPEDLDWPVWAGVIPITETLGTPEPDPRMSS
jgi:nitroimidazol reductase NimA-like FMN-containing flavoprotein (pyridoxamine 5'-phosphate oxidase superfamily)